MCEKCAAAVKKYWPDLPDDQYGTLLYGATCFPFGSPEQVEQHLKEMAEKTNCNLDMALAIADIETEKAMQEIRKEDEEKIRNDMKRRLSQTPTKQ